MFIRVFIISLMIIASGLHASDSSKTFFLKSGDKLTGTVEAYDEEARGAAEHS